MLLGMPQDAILLENILVGKVVNRAGHGSEAKAIIRAGYGSELDF